MLLNQKRCLICATPLTSLRAHTDLLCGNLLCAWKYSAVPETQRCTVCHRALTVPEMAQRTCSSMACRQTSAIENHHSQCKEREQLLKAKGTALRDESAAMMNVQDAASFMVIVVPYNTAVEDDLPDARREQLRARLTEITLEAMAIREAATSPPADGTERAPGSWYAPAHYGIEPFSEELGEVMMNACISCRGACCGQGRDHAYITSNTMLRYMHGHPEFSAEEIVEAYLSHLVSRTMSPGCIYQGPQGCVLPREMRSDTCNNFYCGGLREFGQRQYENSRLQAFFIPTDDNTVDHGVFVAPGYVQVVRAAKREQELLD